MGIIDGSHGDPGRPDIGSMSAKESPAGTALAVQFDDLAGRLPLLAGRPNLLTTAVILFPQHQRSITTIVVLEEGCSNSARDRDDQSAAAHTTFQDGSAALPNVLGMTEWIQARLTALEVSISAANIDQVLETPLSGRFRTPAPI
jgi:hypothetical protein